MRCSGTIMVAVFVGLPLCLPGHATRADGETDVALSEVPAQVLTAVRNARPDIRIHSATRLTEESGVLWEIEGDVGADELEFVVSPDGRIVETDRE